MEEPDPRVVRAAAAGDEAAFVALVRAIQPHLWRFLRHLLGDEDLAADVTQDTLVRVHRSLDRFRFEARFSTWVLRIARNAAIDEQRGQQRRARVEREASEPAPVADGSLGTELQAALATLSTRLREAFVLVEVFGQPYQDAADVLGVPVGTVKSRVFRARLELVAWFGAGEPGQERVGG